MNRIILENKMMNNLQNKKFSPESVKKKFKATTNGPHNINNVSVMENKFEFAKKENLSYWELIKERFVGKQKTLYQETNNINIVFENNKEKINIQSRSNFPDLHSLKMLSGDKIETKDRPSFSKLHDAFKQNGFVGAIRKFTNNPISDMEENYQQVKDNIIPSIPVSEKSTCSQTLPVRVSFSRSSKEFYDNDNAPRSRSGSERSTSSQTLPQRLSFSKTKDTSKIVDVIPSASSPSSTKEYDDATIKYSQNNNSRFSFITISEKNDNIPEQQLRKPDRFLTTPSGQVTLGIHSTKPDQTHPVASLPSELVVEQLRSSDQNDQQLSRPSEESVLGSQNSLDVPTTHKTQDCQESTQREIGSSMTEPAYHEETQYTNLIREIINTGYEECGRNGDTLTKFGYSMRFSLRDGTIPILTTKKIAWRVCFEELFWFIRGATNNKELQEKNVHIWDQNSSREFLDSRGLYYLEEGDLGPIYGFQWRHFNAEYTDSNKCYQGEGVDQLEQIIETLKNPETRSSRRMIMTAWNPCQINYMALPPCHILAQFHVRENKYLSCALYQRSGDVGLGVPFNIASYSLLTHILAKHCGLEADEFIHFLGNCHIYKEHIVPLKQQIKLEPMSFPKIEITKVHDSIDDYCLDDISWIKPYESHPAIKMIMKA